MSITTSPLQDVLDQPAIPVDVRPILVRSGENAWEQTEVIRAALYLLVERVCAERGIEALVLQSHPYVYPAWVKFESWRPTPASGVTARAAMTVTIVPTPYRESEAIYKVEWTKDGQSGAVDQLYQFGETEARGMIGVLASPPSHGVTRRQVRPFLNDLQLRQRWFEFWKPTNRIVPIRRDWTQLASAAALLAGIAFLIAGLQGASAPSSSFEFEPPSSNSFETTPSLPPPSSGSAPVSTDSLQSSALDEGDPRLDDGRIYELRAVRAEAGVPIIVTMQSADFDTYLILGQFNGGDFISLQTNDDAANDGTNSRLEFVPPLAGEYVVLFSSYEPGRTGNYSFSAP